jgi:hypothetical protein
VGDLRWEPPHYTQECEERHVLTFVSTLRRYIDNLITDSFTRTS